MNLTNFKNITFEINTLQPPAAENPDLGTNICDPNGNIIGIRKNQFKLNDFI